MSKRDRFEEFEKKWISDSNKNNNNNKQTFKTASAYQLAVKKKRKENILTVQRHITVRATI